MVTQDFRQLVLNRPFQPFRLVMSSGERVEVRHPELAMVLRTKILIAERQTSGGLGDVYNIFSLLHVTKIEFIEQPEPATADQAA